LNARFSRSVIACVLVCGSAWRRLPAAEQNEAGWRHTDVVPSTLARLMTHAGGGTEAPGFSPASPSGFDLDEPRSGSDWADVLHTGRQIWFRATHPTPRQAWLFGGLAAASIQLERTKMDLQGEAQEARGSHSDRLSSTLRPLGEAIVPIAALSTYFIGRWAGSDRTRRAGLILAESAAFTALTTEVGQYVLSEQRPGDGGDLRFFHPGGHGISGHTSIIASMAVPLDRLFFRVHPDDGRWERFGKYAGKGLVYALPVATGWSRVNDDKHYAWNVLLGLGVGYTVGSFVTSAHEAPDDRAAEGGRSWDVVPITDGERGLGLGVRWVH
jgi:membrane-associated phospholipid phosphatase